MDYNNPPNVMIDFYILYGLVTGKHHPIIKKELQVNDQSN